MTIGTKTLLLGSHWPLHPVHVCLAWRFCYGEWPTWREAVAIVLHDLGYLGCHDLEGAEGLRHPEAGARWADRLLGVDYGNLIRGHSNGYASMVGLPHSKLYAADKVAFALEPGWLWLWRTRLTGEWTEYRKLANNPEDMTDRELFLLIRARMVRGGLAAVIEAGDKDGKTAARGR